MGNPHYNTWGGKNNSWGNKNRKKKNNRTSNNQTRYKPTKLFTVLAGGCLLFLCGALGISVLSNLFTSAKDAVDKVKTIKDVAEDINHKNTPNQADTLNHHKSTGLDIDFDIDIEAEDVKDILDYIYEKIGATNIEDTIVISYEDVKTVEGYQKQIINRLDNYNNFIIVNKEYMEADKMQAEMDQFNHMVAENLDMINGSNYNCIERSTHTNTPYAGDFTIAVTYIYQDN